MLLSFPILRERFPFFLDLYTAATFDVNHYQFLAVGVIILLFAIAIQL